MVKMLYLATLLVLAAAGSHPSSAQWIWPDYHRKQKSSQQNDDTPVGGENGQDIVAFTETPDTIIKTQDFDDRTGRKLDADIYEQIYSDERVQRALKSGNDTQARTFIRDKLCLLGLVDCEDDYIYPPVPPPPAPLGNVLYVQPIKVVPHGPPLPAVPLGHAPPVPYPASPPLAAQHTQHGPGYYHTSTAPIQAPVSAPHYHHASVPGYGPPKVAHSGAGQLLAGVGPHRVDSLAQGSNTANTGFQPTQHQQAHQQAHQHQQQQQQQHQQAQQHVHITQTAPPQLHKLPREINQFPPTYRPLLASHVNRAQPECQCVPQYACRTDDIYHGDYSAILPRVSVNSISANDHRGHANSSISLNQTVMLHQVRNAIEHNRQTDIQTGPVRQRRDVTSSTDEINSGRIFSSGHNYRSDGNIHNSPHHCSHGQVCCLQPLTPTGSLTSGSVTSCGLSRSNSLLGRILNKQGRFARQFDDGETQFGEFPWQAALLRKHVLNEDSEFLCAGVLIGADYLLTAAHCVSRISSHELSVRLGEWNVNSDTEFYPHVDSDVSGVYIHPDFYAGNLRNDLALIKLISPVDTVYNRHISPVCLPPLSADFAGLSCVVSGWGKNAPGNQGHFQNILKKVSLRVVDNYQCERQLQRTRLGRAFKLDHGFLCAGGEYGKDACKGDGGAPLVCRLPQTGERHFLAGIVSWGVGCGQEDVPGVYVKVSEYLPWIDSITAYRPYDQTQGRNPQSEIEAEEYIQVVNE